MFHKKHILLFALALVSLSASAQTSEALLSTRIGHDASREAMAGAGSVSGATAAWASFDNAALAAFNEDMLDVAAGYQRWAPDGSNMLGGGLTLRLGKIFAVTAGATFGLGQAYDIYSSTGVKDGTFTPTRRLLNIGAAAKVTPWLSLGANLHSANETIAEGQSHNAISGDLFVMGRTNGISAAAGLANIGSKIYSASGNEFSLPTSVKVAAGYEGSADKIGYGVYTDIDWFIFSSGLGASLGASASWDKMVTLRAGYHFGSASCFLPSYASLGLGGQFMGIHLDAACLLGGQMTGTVLVTAGYRF